MQRTPIRLLLAFIAATFLLNVFGPVSYLGFRPWLTASFLALVCLAMWIGFGLGVRVFEREQASSAALMPGKDHRPLFYLCLTVALAGLAISVSQAVLAGQLNMSAADLGQTYIDAYANYERNTGSYSATFIIYSLSAPAAFIASVWGLMYFRRLSLAMRLAVVVLIGGSLLFYTIGSGKQKHLGDTLIYLLAVWAIAYGRAGKAVNWRVVVPALVLVFLAVVGFIAILGQRYEALSIDIFNVNVRGHPLLSYDLDHPLFAWLGYDVGFGFSMLSGYLSQGYFGLSLALETHFTWSYMLGFSYSLMVIADRVFGLPFVISHTYPALVGAETGWDESKWHTAFTHWASDVTFPGTIILFGLFAYVWAKAWNRALVQDNPYAVLLFALMLQGAIFLPANNQLFISPGSVATVIIVIVLYVRYAGRAYSSPTAQ